MLTKKQKKAKRLKILLGISFVGLLINLITVLSPVKIELEANYEKGQEGDTVSTLSGIAGTRLSLTTPTSPGYRFLGWSTKKDGTGETVTKVNRSQMKLYAQWEKMLPIASLYVDGHYLRDAVIPDAQAGVNPLGNDFIPSTWNTITEFNKHEWLDEMPILKAYDLTQFRGWYYYDDEGARVEIRYFNDPNLPRWRVYRPTYTAKPGVYTVVTAEAHAIDTTHMFMPKQNIALNAMFNPNPNPTVISGNDLPNMEQNIGRSLVARFEFPGGELISNVSMSNENMPLAFGRVFRLRESSKQTDASSFNSWYNGKYSGQSVIGYKLDDDQDIFTTGHYFYLDSKYVNASYYKLLPDGTSTMVKCFNPAAGILNTVSGDNYNYNGQAVLTFRAVMASDAVVVDGNIMRGTYSKTVRAGGYIDLKRTKTADPLIPLYGGGYDPADRGIFFEPLKSISNELVDFDFTGGSSGLKYTAELGADGRYRSVGTADYANWRFPVRDIITAAYPDSTKDVAKIQTIHKRVALPSVWNYSMPGKSFAGWKNNLDGRIYPAGMDFHVARGTLGTLKFSAVWLDSKRIINFDTLDNQSNWSYNAPVATKKLGAKTKGVDLPEPKRWGYIFVGWRNMSTGLIVDSNNYDYQTFNHDDPMFVTQKLVAVWDAREIGGLNQSTFAEYGYYAPNGLHPTDRASGYKIGDMLILLRGDNAQPLVNRDPDTQDGYQLFVQGSNKGYDNYFFGVDEFRGPTQITGGQTRWRRFSISFVKEVRILLDEDFLKRHARTAPGVNKKDERAVFETMGLDAIIIHHNGNNIPSPSANWLGTNDPAYTGNPTWAGLFTGA